MNHTKDIFLVDDHIIVRNGLRELIEKLGPYRISREYDTGRQMLEDYPSAELPQLIIMDLSMPEMDGDEVMQQLNAMGNEVPVLILTLNTEEDRIVRLFRLGVRGYLHKNCTAAMMRQALEEIFARGFFHNELLTMALTTSEQPDRKNVRDELIGRLSAREMDFMKLVCDEEEYTYDQIAHRMGVHRRTVDGYRESIFDKFGIKSKTGLVLFAIRHKLFEDLS